MLTLNVLRKTLEDALKDRSPSLFNRLRMAGELDPLVERLMGEYSESIGEAMQAAMNEYALMPGGMELVQLINARRVEAEETALQQVIERIDAITASSPVS